MMIQNMGNGALDTLATKILMKFQLLIAMAQFKVLYIILRIFIIMPNIEKFIWFL